MLAVQLEEVGDLKRVSRTILWQVARLGQRGYLQQAGNDSHGHMTMGAMHDPRHVVAGAGREKNRRHRRDYQQQYDDFEDAAHDLHHIA